MEDLQTIATNVPLAALFLGMVFTFSVIRMSAARACKTFGGICDERTLFILGGSVVAYLHAIPACIVSSVLLIRNGDWSVTRPTELRVAAPNTSAEAALVVYTLAFMVYDTVFMIVSLPDVLYILHHLATILYIGSALWIGRGARGIMLCLLWGEITNPLQNTWIIVSALHDAGNEGLFRARKVLTWSTAVALFVLRFIYLPFGLLYVLWIGFGFSDLSGQPDRGAAEVPYALRVIWLLVPSAIIAGTALFIVGILGEQEQRDKAHGHKRS
mmetsp:Transcript_39701/g.97578  ORF Transcript_39701/g.97578 Transcript_39701/m.97578 type:complete len:271 (+) Transcript_39701:57-869(+)